MPAARDERRTGRSTSTDQMRYGRSLPACLPATAHWPSSTRVAALPGNWGKMKLVFWHWVLLFSMLVSSSRGLSSDGLALLALSKSLILPSSIRSNWSTSDATPCTWNGVACNERNRVISLDLSSSEVSGSIGPEIGRLKYLQDLFLSANNISGSIPTELGNCSMLQQLDLSQNSLSGKIPPAIGNLSLLSVYGFRFPVFLTACHMTACALLSCLAHRASPSSPRGAARCRSSAQLARVAVLGAVFCASVVAGNVSLRFLPVSFNQAVGATTPFFTALLAYAVAGRREACATYAALLPVVAGVVIATGGEPSFHLFGFLMCVAATAGRALKTVLQGILLSSEEEKMDSMDLLRYMAPVAVLLLLPATLAMERDAFGAVVALAREDPSFLWILLCNSSLAYFVNLTNFLVTKHTSPLTLQVLGNAKGAVAVVVSILIFRNPVTVVGMLGYGITVAGVVLYGEAKKRSK